MRETWLSENQRLVSQDNFGFDLAAVEAAAKKHEAIETDIFAYEERVTAVEQVIEDKKLCYLLFRIRHHMELNIKN
jgi:spectrin beta